MLKYISGLKSSGHLTGSSEETKNRDRHFFESGILYSAQHLEITVDDAPVVAVLDGLQQCAYEIPRLFFVVNHLLHDAVKQLPPCVTRKVGGNTITFRESEGMIHVYF